MNIPMIADPKITPTSPGIAFVFCSDSPPDFSAVPPPPSNLVKVKFLPEIGANDGPSVGQVVDGDTDGAIVVGHAVGSVVGQTEGTAVGIADGEGVGNTVGEPEGVRVGTTLGADVGRTDGDAVEGLTVTGLKVGCIVSFTPMGARVTGFSVGSAVVGTRVVGFFVGDAVVGEYVRALGALISDTGAPISSNAPVVSLLLTSVFAPSSSIMITISADEEFARRCSVVLSISDISIKLAVSVLISMLKESLD